MFSQTFNITKTSDTNDGTRKLVLLIAPLPTTVGTSTVQSPYVIEYTIVAPTVAQLAGYVTGSQIILTSDK